MFIIIVFLVISHCQILCQTSFKASMIQKILCLLYVFLPICLVQAEPSSTDVFGKGFPHLDHLATGEWWKADPKAVYGKNKGQRTPGKLNIERNQVIAFALYTYDAGTLKLTAQL